MQADEIKKLDIHEKKNFGIEPKHEAFKFILEKVIEERCDEFDYELEEQGFIIVDRDMISVATSIFNYHVIAYKEL